MAHEVYATWQGISIFCLTNNEKLANDVLKGNAEYEHYFSIGQNITKRIKSLYFKRSLLAAITYACFQSKKIAEMAADFKNFEPASVRSIEYPSKRLEYIIENFSPEFWAKSTKKFVESQSQEPYYVLLLQALKNTKSERAFIEDECDIIFEKLIAHYYSIIAENFKAKGSECMPYKSHMQYFERLLPLIDRVAPFKKSKNPIIISRYPNDLSRAVLQNYESEALQITKQPLNCVVWHPNKINDIQKEELSEFISDEPTIFITGRNFYEMVGQYKFDDLEDAKWFADGGTKVFTSIRFGAIIDDVNTVVYIPFENPGELVKFISGIAKKVKYLAAVSVTASDDRIWWKLWDDFFCNKCISTCLIMNSSPLYYIENIFPDNLDIIYNKLEVHVTNTKHTCLNFQIMQNNKCIAFMLAPCTRMYYDSLHYFLERRYPSFKNENRLPSGQLSFIQIILSHIYQEEHLFYFRSPWNGQL